MKRKEKKGLKIFLIFITIVSFLPLIQYVFEPLVLKDLSGAFDLAEKPTFNKKNWENSNFQDNASLYLTHHTPFRADFVRLKNELNYWFFDEINTILTLGTENYIYDPNYINARTGSDLLSTDSLMNKKYSLIKTKSILDSLNIPILFCFAPNKANYFAEFLPQTSPLAVNRNQTKLEKILKELNLPLINFDKIFLSQKSKTDYSLMAKYGAHWSTYGAYVAGGMLCKSIDSLMHKENIKISLIGIEKSTKARFTDDDYIPSLNLISHWRSPELAYPQLELSVDTKPNVLIVSDSFFWNFYDLNIVQSCFSEQSEMWYYNKTSYNYLKEKIGTRPTIISKNEIKDRDIIIVLSSDPGLKEFGYGFFEQLSVLNDN